MTRLACLCSNSISLTLRPDHAPTKKDQHEIHRYSQGFSMLTCASASLRAGLKDHIKSQYHFSQCIHNDLLQCLLALKHHFQRITARKQAASTIHVEPLRGQGVLCTLLLVLRWSCSCQRSINIRTAKMLHQVRWHQAREHSDHHTSRDAYLHHPSPGYHHTNSNCHSPQCNSNSRNDFKKYCYSSADTGTTPFVHLVGFARFKTGS